MFKGIVSGIILILSASFAFAQTSDIIYKTPQIQNKVGIDV